MEEKQYLQASGYVLQAFCIFSLRLVFRGKRQEVFSPVDFWCQVVLSPQQNPQYHFLMPELPVASNDSKYEVWHADIVHEIFQVLKVVPVSARFRWHRWILIHSPVHHSDEFLLRQSVTVHMQLLHAHIIFFLPVSMKFRDLNAEKECILILAPGYSCSV